MGGAPLTASRIFTLMCVVPLWIGSGTSASFAQQRLDGAGRIDTTLSFRTVRVEGGRLDTEHQVLRSAYYRRIDERPASVDDLIRGRARSFGWSPRGADLELTSEQRTRATTHLTFRQTYANLPVHDRNVRVSLDREERVTLVMSSYTPIDCSASEFDSTPRVSSKQAEDVARQEFAPAGGQVGGTTLVVVPGDRPTLAWRTLIFPNDRPAEFRVLVNAWSGELIHAVDQALRLSHAPRSLQNNDPHEPARPRSKVPSGEGFTTHRGPGEMTPPGEMTRPDEVSRSGEVSRSDDRDPSFPNTRVHGSRRRVDGTGLVYIPGPLMTSGAMYSPPYVDNDDATSQELDAERIEVVLRDISQNTSTGMYELIGPYVQITGQNFRGSVQFTPPTESSPNSFRYRRDEPGFEAVNAYYHIDSSQRHVQSLGIFDRQNGPLRVNPRDLLRDDSFYLPNQNVLVFGLGGVDDAEDATVIWHEYAHALLHAATPGILNGSSLEGVALHEGWSDYWATSYVRDLVESGRLTRDDWERIFVWDSGDGVVWDGRVMDHAGHYPEDICSDTGNAGTCSPHDDGRLWATTLHEVRDHVDRNTLDEMVLRSHQYLGGGTTFSDAAYAVIQSDLDFFGGAHVELLIDIFGARGLVDPSDFGPVVVHEALPNTEALDENISISARVSALSSAIDTVIVHVETDTGGVSDLGMVRDSNDTYTVDYVLPTSPDTVRYYIEARDESGSATLVPGGAPGTRYSFGVGPDHVAPVLAHTAIEESSLLAWPEQILTEVTDNIGVQRVFVEYSIESLSGELLDEGMFDLAEAADGYVGLFPALDGIIQSNAVVTYRIRAVDSSDAENEAMSPPSGMHSFRISGEGLLSKHSFEGGNDHSLTLDGEWEIGAPEFGQLAAYEGNSVVVTSSDGPTSARAGLSTMELPRINLTGIDSARLQFWHWFDTEHDGSADPATTGAMLFDGGNVKISVDGGQTWSVLVPTVGSYPGTISTSTQNPMTGEQAYGGFSYAWRLARFELPAEDDVRIRFQFGTDKANSSETRSSAGWAIDDLQITTEQISDSMAPVLQPEPPTVQVLSTADARPMIRASVADDTGVTDVYLDYSFGQPGNTTAGTIRMEQSPSSLSRFEASADFAAQPVPGDVLTYRIRLEDPLRNASDYPLGSTDGYRLEYRLVEVADASIDVVASGNWIPLGLSGSSQSWRVESTGGTVPVSSLNMKARELPGNAEDVFLEVSHSYQFVDVTGGNVKISTDRGRIWRTLFPNEGYGGIAPLSENHPMTGEDVFSGVVSEATDVFDLGGLSGSQVLIRFDFGSESDGMTGDFWHIGSMKFVTQTSEPVFNIDRETAMHPAFPNPFQNRATVSVTVARAGHVRVEMYDMLGRRVAVLEDGTLDAGTHVLPIKPGNWAAGVYLLRMIADGKDDSQTVVYSK